MSNESAKQTLAKTTTESLVPFTGTEIASTAAAAQVKALVEARFVLAIKTPRNMEQVRLDLIKECSRPSFALEDIEGKGNSAYYRKPVGGSKFVEGLGIRYAEVAERCMGNLMTDAITIQDSAEQRVKYCFVLDLEKNNSWGDTVHISKTVERKQLKDGDVPLKSRRNSQGEMTYTIEASEDALATKEAALISKKMRTLILRMVPGDLQDECVQEIKKVREKRIMEDPDAAIRGITDLMFKVNVTVPMVEAYLKHPVAQCSPGEIINLQGLYSSILSNDTTWTEIMENATAEAAAKSREPGGNEGMRAKVAEAAQATTPPQTQQPQQQPQTSTPPTQPTTTAQPTPQPTATGPAKGAPPWMKKTAAPAEQAPPQTEPVTAPIQPEQTMEEKVAAMAASKQPDAVTTPTEQPTPPIQPVATQATPAATPAQRIKPKHPSIKKVGMPEFADRVGPEDAWSQDQYNRMATAMAKVPGGHSVEQTAFEWIGIPLEQINAATVECMITVLENWKVKTA